MIRTLENFVEAIHREAYGAMTEDTKVARAKG